MKRDEEATLFVGIGRAGCRTLGFLADRFAETVEAGGEASGNPAFLFVKTGKGDDGNARFPSATVHLGREAVAGWHLFPPCVKDGRPDNPEDADCWWFDPDGQPYQIPPESSASARPEVNALNGAHLAWSSMRQVDTAVEELADGTDLLDGWLPDGVRHVDVVSVFSSAVGVDRGAWALVVSAVKAALARKGIGSIRSRAVVFDVSCFLDIGQSSPDRAARMRANSLSFLSELPLWLELAKPGCDLPSLERPDWGGGRFDRIVLADARSPFSPNRVPVDGWNLFFGIRQDIFPEQSAARLLQLESSKEHDNWTAGEINNWHPVQTKVAASLFVDDSILRNRFALWLLQRWGSDWKDGIPSEAEAVRARLSGFDQSRSGLFRVPESTPCGNIEVAADLGQDEFEAFFVRRCDKEKTHLERIKREFVQRVAGGDPGVVATWLRTAVPVRSGDFPLAEILERNRSRWFSDWERGLPNQEEDSWGRLLECAGRKVARASVRKILSDVGETRRFFVSALLGSGRRQLDARSRFANAKTDAMVWLPAGFGDSPDWEIQPSLRDGIQFRTSDRPDRVDAVFAAFPEAGRDNFVQSFDGLPALRDRKVLELLEEAEDPETGGCFVRDGEKWSSALAPVSFPLPEFVRNPAFARLRWRPWKKEFPKATLGPTPKAGTERRTNGGAKSTGTDIFISYSRRDLAAVTPIKEEIEKAGFSCWMDLEGVESGSEEFTDSLVAAIGASTVLLFFLSESSQKSEWSLKEIRFAKRKRKRIVIVRFNDDPMTDSFDFNFGGSDIIDWWKAEQKAKLLRDLRGWLDASESSEPSPGFRRMVDFGTGPFGFRWIPAKGSVAGFWMGETPVTQELWTAVMESNPSHFKGDDRRPVERVSWNDCQEFLRKLNALDAVSRTDLAFRLPTSEEWGQACRAGGTGKYCRLADGTEITEETLGRVAWFDGNSDGMTHPVGLKEPNALGLYDMHGNVGEWTQTADGENRVERGGSWCFSAAHCVSLSSGWGSAEPSLRHFNLGLRLCASMKNR